MNHQFSFIVFSNKEEKSNLFDFLSSDIFIFCENVSPWIFFLLTNFENTSKMNKKLIITFLRISYIVFLVSIKSKYN